MAGGENPYLTVGQVAHRCGVSNRTVLNWIKQRGLTAHRLPSGHYRVHRDVLRAYLARQARARGDAGAGGAVVVEVPTACWLHPAVGQSHDCVRCGVARAHALHCFVLRPLLPPDASGCGEPCSACAYFLETVRRIGDSLELESVACVVARGPVLLGTNSAAQRLVGYDADELIGLAATRLIAEDARPIFAAIGRRLRLGVAEGPMRFDTALVTRAGERIEVTGAVTAFPRVWGSVLATMRPR